jgi:hypothetical protein
MKMKNKKVIYGVLFIFFIIILGLIMPMLGKVSPTVTKNMRIMNLQRWHERACLYIDDKGRLPESLYDVYYSFDIRYSSMLINPENKNKINGEIYNNDPNAFCVAIDYVFEKNGNNWFIKESKLYKSDIYLYIDSLGAISEYSPKTR